MQAKAEQEKNLVQQAKQAYISYKEELPRRKALAASYQDASTTVPLVENLAPFLVSLNSWARTSGVQIQNFTPGAAASGPGYTIYPCALAFTGSYGQGLTFLRLMEASTRLVGIQEVTVTTQGAVYQETINFHLYDED